MKCPCCQFENSSDSRFCSRCGTQLKVISRTSVTRYKGMEKDIREIGRELDVATILEGSIQKERDNMRINA